MEEFYRLNELKTGESATVWALSNPPALRRRLRDMGMIEGACIKRIGISPSGDPSAYFIHGTVLAIRAIDASQILVKPMRSRRKTEWD